MLFSAGVLAVLLSLVKLPPPGQFLPILELVIELSRIEPRAEPEPEAIPPPPVPQTVDETVLEETVTEPAPAPSATDESSGELTLAEWEVLREEAIRQVLDALEREAAYSVNPPLTRARQEAAVRFRASVAPAERHIWDNVEKDQLGRTILRDGNCFRVLDDPSVANRWAFENFDQYIVYCDLVIGGGGGRDLPWVEIIRERYPYLRDPVAIP